MVKRYLIGIILSIGLLSLISLLIYDYVTVTIKDKKTIDMLAPGLHARNTSAIDRKLEEMYRPYIAGNWFYIAYYDYSTNPDNNHAIKYIDIKRSKTDTDKYIFTVYLDNINNENEQDIIKGIAQVQRSDRKINNLQFFKAGS